MHVDALAKDWRESVNHDSSTSSFRTMYAGESERMENGSHNLRS